MKAQKEIVHKLATLIIAAFGLVSALAWNDTIKAIFAELFSTPNRISAMLIYSMSVTIIAVLITLYLGRLAK